jgi:hypothetical protein
MPISSALGSSALLPAGLGFRNLLINGDFRINQRGYASASTLASGAYGFDRWKSTLTNTSLTFTSAPQGQVVTISSGGSIEQVVERQNILPGTYILSWEGTATGRVYNSGATPPAFASSPILVTLDGLANVEVEFTASGSAKTLWKPQLELNYQVTPFEQRPIGVELSLCQRYYQVWTSNATGTAICVGFSDGAGTAGSMNRPIVPNMRVAPTNSFSGVIYATDFSVYRQLTALTSDRNTADTFTAQPSYSGGTLNASRPAYIYGTGGSIILSAEL